MNLKFQRQPRNSEGKPCRVNNKTEGKPCRVNNKTEQAFVDTKQTPNNTDCVDSGL
jgi:hypothetical protein